MSVSLTSSTTSFLYNNKKFKMIYLTRMISIQNSIFTAVFYAVRWTKLDLTCIYFQKKLTHHCLKSSPSICSHWISRMIFFHFWTSKIRVSPTDSISSLSSPRCRLSSGRHHHAVVLCPIEPRRARYLCFIVILGFYAKTEYSSYAWPKIKYSTHTAKRVHRKPNVII
jgi:hypothetical protein